MQNFVSHSVEDTKRFGASLAHNIKPGDVYILTGDLGAGKTQLVQGFAKEIGIIQDCVSPTFNILLEYKQGRIPLYHFDLYRLQHSEELEDVAFYETVESDGVSFIEWGEKFATDMPEDARVVNIKVLSDGSREISVL